MLALAEEMLTPQQVAEELDVHLATIYRWIERGRLRSEPANPAKLNPGRLVPRSEVERLKRGEPAE